MIDLDHFKFINDTHGHAAGDAALCAVAQELAVDSALLGRLGGEEFALLVEGRMGDVRAMAERLRGAVAGLVLGGLKLTCSFGVSEWRRGDTIDGLLKRADMALYEAKLGGRNRVCCADTPALGISYPETQRLIRAARSRA
jgi:diguanylate cyclase (GGDEF)-like protein